MSESAILNQTLVVVTAIPDDIYYRQNSGLFFTREGRPVRAAVPGAGDIIGVHRILITPEMVGRHIGLAVSLETKTQTGRQSAQQRAFQRAWERAGGLYLIVRSPDEALCALGTPP